MYAIIADGGRQYKVEEGQELDVDFRGLSRGAELKFEQVLALRGDEGLRLGTPTLAGACVVAEVMGVSRGKKQVVQKIRRRKNSRSKRGHRQWYTRVRIQKIEL